MRSQAKNILVFLGFLNSLNAQFIPEADARLIAWRAYGTFVQQQLTAGVPLRPGQDFIFVTPPNLAAVRGGTPCPDSVTNFDLFSLADALQTVNEPLLDNSGASYVDSLFTYLQSVDLGTATPTAAQLAQIQILTDALSTASDKFDAQSNVAYTKYLADVRAQAAHQGFGAWVTANNPLYTSLLRQRNEANTALQNYEVSVYGAQFATLGSQRDKIQNNAGDELASEPGYNMPVYGAAGTYNVHISPFQSNQITDGLIWKPAYSLAGGFEEVCDTWINYTGPANTFYNWNMVNVNGEDWSSLGHSTTVSDIGGNAFWGLISASSSSSTTTTVFNSWSQDFSTTVSLKLNMKGIEVFNVNAGFWDVGSVRTTYPHLLPAPIGVDSLASKVKLQRLLIGSEVGLTITVSDTGTYNSIYNFVQDATSSAGGGVTIFGFHFGGGSSNTIHRNISDVSFTQLQEGGQVVIAPSPKGVPVQLGALGVAL
jgi:hypothetical protein